MPMLGFGVFQITDEKECEASVLTALRTGYHLLLIQQPATATNGQLEML